MNNIYTGEDTVQWSKKSIIAGTRKIKTSYTLDLQQDLESYHGVDIEKELMRALQQEISKELLREYDPYLALFDTGTAVAVREK